MIIFPIEILNKNNETTTDFNFFGANVYDISRQVIDTNISPLVKIAYAKICHPIFTLLPISIQY